ncbi:hypothetical protein ACWCYK_30590 [Streptomyces lydicamycinicus]
MLLQVEKQTPTDEPLLASLIAVNDTSSAQLYLQLRTWLGRGEVGPGWWQSEVLRLPPDLATPVTVPELACQLADEQRRWPHMSVRVESRSR